jgi:hypothetical protein
MKGVERRAKMPVTRHFLANAYGATFLNCLHATRAMTV